MLWAQVWTTAANWALLGVSAGQSRHIFPPSPSVPEPRDKKRANVERRQAQRSAQGATGKKARSP